MDLSPALDTSGERVKLQTSNNDILSIESYQLYLKPPHADVNCRRQADIFQPFFKKEIEIQSFIAIFTFSMKNIFK